MGARLLLALLAAGCAGSPASAAPEEFDPPRTFAVIAGVLRWADPRISTFSPERRKDVELGETLSARGVPAGRITLLLDSEATLAKMTAAVREAARRAGPKDTLLFYYAGHGTKNARGVEFANYDYDPAGASTGFSLDSLAALLETEFRGAMVLLMADCCHSGGLGAVARRLSSSGINAVSLTSADASNTSTSNWTFTQTVIDGLRGDPLMDADGDGRLTLRELADEVGGAMKHRESQRHGFAAFGVRPRWCVAAARPRGPSGPPAGSLRLGQYVRAPRDEGEEPARVVDFESGAAVVEFYDYTEKKRISVSPARLTPIRFKTYPPGARVTALWSGIPYPAKVLRRDGDFHWITYPGWPSYWDEWALSTRLLPPGPAAPAPSPQPPPPPRPGPAPAQPGEVEVEWQGTWWRAKILKWEGGKRLVHYSGWEDSWDEWVGPERVREVRPSRSL